MFAGDVFLIITTGCGDEAGHERTAPNIRERAHEQDEKLAQAGVRIGPAGEPVQVRNPQGRGIESELAPFMSSQLPLAGFMLIEADNLEHAIALVADTPCAVADGVVEVWPIEETRTIND